MLPFQFKSMRYLVRFCVKCAFKCFIIFKYVELDLTFKGFINLIREQTTWYMSMQYRWMSYHNGNLTQAINNILINCDFFSSRSAFLRSTFSLDLRFVFCLIAITFDDNISHSYDPFINIKWDEYLCCKSNICTKMIWVIFVSKASQSNWYTDLTKQNESI